MGVDSLEQEICSPATRQKLYRFGLKLWGRSLSCEDVEDLVQDVLVDALRTRVNFRGECALFSWLCQIFVFKAITLARKRAREVSLEQMSEDTSLEQDGTPVFEPSTYETPEDELLVVEQAQQIRVGLGHLSPAHLETVRCMYYEDLSLYEAAARMGIPESTVKTRMFYARKMLREHLVGQEA